MLYTAPYSFPPCLCLYLYNPHSVIYSLLYLMFQIIVLGELVQWIPKISFFLFVISSNIDMISLLCYFGALNFSCVRPRAQKARKRQKMSSWQILGQYGPDIKILPFLVLNRQWLGRICVWKFYSPSKYYCSPSVSWAMNWMRWSPSLQGAHRLKDDRDRFRFNLYH